VEEGFGIETRLFPAEEIAFAEGSFLLVTARVAPHHFSSPQKFVKETARVLRPGGHFLLIDGAVPDDDPETEEWLHCARIRDSSLIRPYQEYAGSSPRCQMRWESL
jgi:SAM-dependent methyltransferase